MRVLLTGVSGYLGCSMANHLLRKGHSVIGLDRPGTFGSLTAIFGDPYFKAIPVNLLDFESWRHLLQEVDAVCHLAAVVSAKNCEGVATDLAYQVNTELTGKIASSLTSQRLVYPNTNSGYGVIDRKEFYTEEDPLEPISAYGKSKLLGEQAVLSYKNGVSFRLGSGFGVSPNMRWDLMLHDFVKKCLTGSIKLFEPSAKRNFVHVRDVARAFEFAINNNLTGIYNLNLPHHPNKFELVDLISRETKQVVLTDVVSGTDTDRRDYIVKSTKLSNTGFQFCFSIRSGVTELVNYSKSEQI